MYHPETHRVGITTVCIFHLAVCDRLKQPLISVGRLSSTSAKVMNNQGSMHHH